MWMLCFSSEYELGQFERSLLKKYKEIFQVNKKLIFMFSIVFIIIIIRLIWSFQSYQTVLLDHECIKPLNL